MGFCDRGAKLVIFTLHFVTTSNTSRQSFERLRGHRRIVGSRLVRGGLACSVLAWHMQSLRSEPQQSRQLGFKVPAYNPNTGKRDRKFKVTSSYQSRGVGWWCQGKVWRQRSRNLWTQAISRIDCDVKAGFEQQLSCSVFGSDTSPFRLCPLKKTLESRKVK